MTATQLHDSIPLHQRVCYQLNCCMTSDSIDWVHVTLAQLQTSVILIITLLLRIVQSWELHIGTVPLNSNLTHTRDFREGTREILYDTREIFPITPHVYLM